MFLKFQISIFIFLSCFLVQVYGQILTEESRLEYQKLLSAVANWDVAETIMLLREGVYPNPGDGLELRTPFHVMRNFERIDDGVGSGQNSIGGTYYYDKYTWEDRTEKNMQMFDALIEAGAKLTGRDKNGRNSLHSILSNLCVVNETGIRSCRSYESITLDNDGIERVIHMINTMIENGIDLNMKDNYGIPPLHILSEAVSLVPQYIPILEVLIEAGIDLNLTDKKGKTMLHKLFDSNRRVAEILIRAGADPTIRDGDGNLAPVIKENPDLLQSYLSQRSGEEEKEEEEEATSCEYVGERTSQIQIARYSICLAEVSCTFEVGAYSRKNQIERNFQAVCSRLADGQCPPANDCVLDRSVMELAENQTEKTRPSLTVPVEPYSSGFR